MEKPKPCEDIPQAHESNARSTAEPSPSDHSPQPPAPPSQPAEIKKRPLENGNTQVMNSKYFKMRLIVRDLRPHVIEVLRTPDFRNCEAAREIREKIHTSLPKSSLRRLLISLATHDKEMKLLMELYKEMGDDQKIPAKSQPHLGDGFRETLNVEGKTLLGVVSEKQQTNGKETSGSYIVGGSAFGWNFVTFSGSSPAYYGVTKESFRATQVKLEEQ